MKSRTVMLTAYDKRKPVASMFLTKSDIDSDGTFNQDIAMLDKRALLAEVEALAGSRAEIGRVLNLPGSRITELFKGKRELSYEEARKLCLHYHIGPGKRVSAKRLAALLKACLQPEQPQVWTDEAVARLAEEVEYGLSLLQSDGQHPISQDAVDLAARVASDRFRNKPA